MPVREGLLFVLSEPAPGTEADFHAWYDDEHGPARLGIPGIANGYRYHAVDGVLPSWLACYGLDLDVLDTAEYRRLRERRSHRERAVIASLRTLERRVYRLVQAAGQPPSSPATLLVATSLSVPDECATELDAWYTEEHIPLLQQVPGWGRTRRYQLRDGDAPRHLALHEVTGPEVFETEAYRHATSTPRRGAVMATVTARERRVFSHHSTFHG